MASSYPPFSWEIKMSEIVSFKRVTLVMTGLGNPIPITVGNEYTHQIEVFPAAANAGAVYMGDKDVDNTYIPRAANTITVFTSTEKGDTTGGGDYFNLKHIYFCGLAADVVTIQYLKKQNVAP